MDSILLSTIAFNYNTKSTLFLIQATSAINYHLVIFIHRLIVKNVLD